MAKNFLQLFSPEAKWCCPEAKDGVLKESPLSFFSRTKNEVRVREKKLNGLSWRTTSFCWRTTSSYEWEKKTLKNFLWRTKESLTFLRNYIILPKEKKKWQKNFAIPKLSNPPMISRGIKIHFLILRVGITFMRERFHFPRTLTFSIFCYPDQRHFFYLDLSWLPNIPC